MKTVFLICDILQGGGAACLTVNNFKSILDRIMMVAVFER